jgi:O-antigen/teichoic acid export membrane protein
MIRFKEFASRLVNLPYEMIFKERMSRDVTDLLRHTSYAAIGTLFGALISSVFTILAARILGPANFGDFSLITVVGVIFGLSMALGLSPMIVYASRARDESEQTRIISTAYILMALFTVASVIIYVLLSSPLSQIIGISVTLYLFALAYALTSAFFALTLNSFRIFFKMKTYALLNAGQSIVVLVVFLVFVSSGARSWQSAGYSLFISYVAISLTSLVVLRKYISLRFDRFWSKRIVHYLRFAIPGAIAGACMGIDRILINIFGTAAEVGIYSAYFLSSITVALMLSTIVNAAFFPYASRSRDKGSILVKINKAAPYVSISLVPPFVLVERIVFFLYGHQYPFSWEIAFFFALAAVLTFFYQCYGYLMGSEGPQGAQVNTRSGIIAFVVLICLDVLLIPLTGILGATLTLIIAYLIGILYLTSHQQTLDGRLAEAPQTLSGDR